MLFVSEVRKKDLVWDKSAYWPLIYLIYIFQKETDKVRGEIQVGVEVHKERIDLLRFVYCIIIIKNEQDMQRIVRTIHRIIKEDFNMKIKNLAK